MKVTHVPSSVPASAIDSPKGEVMERLRASIAPLRRLTLPLSEIDPGLVRPFSRWCVKSEQAINEGRAPDWDVLIAIINGNAEASNDGYMPERDELLRIINDNSEALRLVRKSCSELDTYLTKLAQGLVGERTEGTNISSPHSSRDSGQFVFEVNALALEAAAQVAIVDESYVQRPGIIARPASSNPPPESKVVPRKNTLAKAIAASARSAKSGGKE